MKHANYSLSLNLSVSPNLHRFAFVPRVVQVLNLLEAEVPPADPVEVENPTKSLGRQARGEKPRHLNIESEAMENHSKHICNNQERILVWLLSKETIPLVHPSCFQ